MGSIHWSPRFALLEDKETVVAGLARIQQILKQSERKVSKGGVASAASWMPGRTAQDDIDDVTCDAFFSTPSVGSTAFF